MDVKSEYEYPWPSTINVANFVTVKPCVKGEDRTNFKIWKEQMLCLLESQDLLGFVHGEVLPPEKNAQHQYNQWRRTDRLVKGWILGSVGKDVLDAVWEKQTARDVWVELDNNIFSEKDEDEEDSIISENDEDEEDSIFSEKDEDEEDSIISENDDVQIKNSGKFSKYLPLYQATLRGDWESAKSFFEDEKELCTTIITADSETALHIAVMTGHANDFVKKLVKLAPSEELGCLNSSGDTALHIAAVVGNTEAATALVEKNPNLVYILNKKNRLPLQRAVIYCQRQMVTYLISKYDPNADPVHNPFQGQLGLRLLDALISSEFVDVALDLVERHPDMALLHKDGNSALSAIAQTSTLFTSTQRFSWWQKLHYHCIPVKISKREGGHSTSTVYDIESPTCDGATHKNYFSSFKIIFKVWEKVESMILNVVEHIVPKAKELREKKTRHQQTLQLVELLCQKLVSSPENEALSEIFKKALLEAANYGNSEMIEKIIDNYPLVIFHVDHDNGRNIFQVAARYRFENIINLIYNMSDRRFMVYDSTDHWDNNLMHICGKLAPPDRLNLVPGAALQMQRELQWFKEMEKYVHPSRRTWRNKEKQTPQEIFTKGHEKLKADGEAWMKDTANACTISAALIATVMFAAAFTIPGGLQSETGKPLFSTRPTFILFAISDAISLFTSITSLLMFLSILTSRYAEEDFLYLLPKRLSIGLLSLFVSISFMMLAFSATLYLVLQNDAAWFLVLLVALGFLPATSFVLLQGPLLFDVLRSTYGPGIFGKKSRLFLY